MLTSGRLRLDQKKVLFLNSLEALCQENKRIDKRADMRTASLCNQLEQRIDIGLSVYHTILLTMHTWVIKIARNLLGSTRM